LKDFYGNNLKFYDTRLLVFNPRHLDEKPCASGQHELFHKVLIFESKYMRRPTRQIYQSVLNNSITRRPIRYMVHMKPVKPGFLFTLFDPLFDQLNRFSVNLAHRAFVLARVLAQFYPGRVKRNILITSARNEDCIFEKHESGLSE